MRSKDGEVTALGRESPENVRRVDRQGVFAKELFAAKYLRQIILGPLPIGKSDTKRIITWIEGQKIEAVRVQHPHTRTRRSLIGRISLVIFWGFTNREIKSGENSIRPVQKPGWRRIMLHETVPSPLIVMVGKPESLCKL